MRSWKELRRSCHLYVNGIHAFLSVFHFERHAVVLMNLIHKSGGVNKNFLAIIITDDEAISLRLVEEFYLTCVHRIKKFELINVMATNIN